MAVRNAFYIILGLVLGISLTVVLNSVSAITLAEKNYYYEEQLDYKKKTGSFYPVKISDTLSINTYTSICDGFYILEETPTEITSIGFGDLKDQYTYTIIKPKKDDKATSTTATSTPV